MNLKLFDRLDYLLNAVADGKGLSQIDFAFSYEEPNDVDESVDASNGVDAAITNDITDDFESERHQDSKDREKTLSQDPTLPKDTVLGNAADSTSSEEKTDHISFPDVGTVGNSVPDPELEVNSKPTNLGGEIENIFDLEVPLDVGSKSPGNELQDVTHVDDGDIIDYSEDEVLAGDSSAGSLTLQGDMMERQSSALRTTAAEKVLAVVEDSAVVGNDPEDDFTEFGKVKRFSEPVVDQQDGETYDSNANSPEYVDGSDAHEPTEEWTLYGNEREPEEDFGRASSFRNGELYGEHADDDQIRTSNYHRAEFVEPAMQSDLSVDEHDSALSMDDTLTQDQGPEDEHVENAVGNSVTSIYVSSSPHKRSNSDDKSSHVAFDNANLEGAAKQASRSAELPMEFKHSGIASDDADEITYDEDEDAINVEELSVPSLKPVTSPPSLKRSHDDHEFDTETNEVSSGKAQSCSG